MKNEIISERQGIILITLFIIGSTFLIGSGGAAKQDAWIAVIIAIFCSIILLLMFSRILSLYPRKDLFDILQIVMGKFAGKIIGLLMIWFAFHLGALVLRNISEFTKILIFSDTPVLVPMLFLIMLIIWNLKAGIEVLGRWSEFFIWIVMIISLFLTVFLIPEININRLKPILNNGISTLINGTFSSFCFPFGETVVFTMVFSNISKIKSYNKVFIIGLLIGGGIIFLATFRNIIVLGSETISRIYFPTSMVVSLIHLGPMFQRLEILVVIAFLICVFVKVSICTLAVCNGISKVFGFNDYKFIATPVALLMLSFSFMLYKSTMEMSFWAFNVYPYYSFIFEVIIPLVIFILAEIKSRSSSTTIVTK
ncbi:endospore germination permease [Clostridium estertheticum]|uniref:GerAB/ArcD/ProY family transporter n=1 Tax=Clostridium estertheticum TaxID=238834 RepID=UPI001CF37973|nr:endospore germination permease [Clostridium estertheticum]MCB2305343.1 endospore germination permease [Clostridium estertheticum]MCB2343781.1 endospore germination permease [Clostridium estertheticum]MCB2348699.1 endospore germination permease [Clostridium estertheticum]WAG46021.1 endospore germination permease [Clostridium estertheticum]